MVEVQTAKYEGAQIPFATDKDYTTAKVMVWNDLLEPICEAKVIE